MVAFGVRSPWPLIYSERTAALTICLLISDTRASQLSQAPPSCTSELFAGSITWPAAAFDRNAELGS